MMILCVCNGSTVFFRGGLEWPICPLYRPPCLIHTHPTLPSPRHSKHPFISHVKANIIHTCNLPNYLQPHTKLFGVLPTRWHHMHCLIALLDPSVGIFIIQSHISYKTYNGWISRPIDRTWVL